MLAEQSRAEQPYYLLTDEVSERINILKLWLSIMVVFIHSSNAELHFAGRDVVLDVPAWLSTFKFIVLSISSCAVPGFFFMAAIFLYRKPFSWKANVQKKVHTLVIPYFILNSFWIAFYFCLQHIPSLSPFFSKPENIVANWGLLRWIGAYFSNGHLIVVPTWFMRDLFVLNIFAVLIMKILDMFPKISTAVLLLTWLCFHGEIYKSSSYELAAICFFGLGCLFIRQNFKLEMFDKILAPIHWSVYLILLIANVLTRELPLNMFIGRINVLYGIIFWYSCATSFQKGKLKNFLLGFAAFNFSIYIFHDNMLSCVRKVFVRVFPVTPAFQLLLYVFVPILIIIYCVTLSVLLKKYLPRFYALVTGNRG